MKRYIHTLRDSFVEMPFSGPWVRYEDAAELQRRLDAIRAYIDSDEMNKYTQPDYIKAIDDIKAIAEGKP